MYPSAIICNNYWGQFEQARIRNVLSQFLLVSFKYLVFDIDIVGCHINAQGGVVVIR